MSLKCKGCGTILQYINPLEKGYALNETQEYCQRCYRLTHYGDIKNIKTLNYNNLLNDIFIKYKNDLFVFIVDAYEALVLESEGVLERFKNNKLILLINKIDLLPRNITDDRIEEIYNSIYTNLKNKYSCILDIVITHKFDSSFNDLFINMLNELKFNTVVFIGKANAGKSTILNKLLANNDLTTSIYPGTTTDEIIIKYDRYTFIDTPGLYDSDNLLTYLSPAKLKSFLRYKTIKPLVFQLYEPQSYYMSGLFRIDVNPKEHCSIIFESNRNDIHRTKTTNTNNYEKNNKFEYSLTPWSKSVYKAKGEETYLIKGFGLIRIKGNADITIMINDKIKVYTIGNYL